MASPSLDPAGVVLECPSCAQKNRVAFGRLGERTRCGRCKTAIPAPSEPIDVPSVAAFDALTRDAALPVVVDFWADWCGPCRMMAPELARVAAAHAGGLVVAKVDTEALPELAARYQVRSIPLLSVFVDGRLVGSEPGARPAPAIEAFIRQSVGQGR